MNKHSLRTFLIVMFALTVTQVVMSAQPAPDNAAPAASNSDRRGIEGVWDAIVTPVNCDTGEPRGRLFQEVLMFMRGGTFTEINRLFRRSPSVGTWRHLKGRSFTSFYINFRFNPNDSFAGKSTHTVDIKLSEDGDELTSTVSVQRFNAADELIETACFVATATRLEEQKSD